MEILSFHQGSPEWAAHRAKHFNASDAPAMLGCSPYMTRSELLHRMRYQAHHDSLTDVLSRNGFVQASNSLLQRLTHESGSVAVLMLDLDHFKRVNDSYGHATGDLLLREFTRTMTQTLRPQDVLGRIGGEEFAVVLPRISAADAATIAERLCHAEA